MDKVKKYQQIISSFLTDYIKDAKLSTANDVEPRLLIDTINDSFQLLYIGWQGTKFIFSPIFHFDIINGKVWVQRNNTELPIDEILHSKGIDNQDIILGFQPEFVRKTLATATN
jgi:hypothetical protein